MSPVTVLCPRVLRGAIRLAVRIIQEPVRESGWRAKFTPYTTRLSHTTGHRQCQAEGVIWALNSVGVFPKNDTIGIEQSHIVLNVAINTRSNVSFRCPTRTALQKRIPSDRMQRKKKNLDDGRELVWRSFVVS